MLQPATHFLRQLADSAGNACNNLFNLFLGPVPYSIPCSASHFGELTDNAASSSWYFCPFNSSGTFGVIKDNRELGIAEVFLP